MTSSIFTDITVLKPQENTFANMSVAYLQMN